MTTIDNKVVQMRFDNQEFEKRVNTSVKSLSILKKQLNFDAESSSLSNFNKNTKNFSLANIENSISSISDKFSTLGIIGITTLQNLTNAAVNAGVKILKALTIDPITTGLKEYETNLNGIQTILASTKNKGENLDSVGKALDVLNEYSDKTIYNFGQMVTGIKTLTTSGAGLQTSVDVVKGFANAAALAGVGAEEMARSLQFGLNQAISKGRMMTQDWMSLETAGIASDSFKQSIMETARVNGIAVDKIIEKNGSFRDSLSEGWLTADILQKTLAKYTGEMSDAQLKQLGYTDEQIVKIQELAAEAVKSATKVKTISQLFDTLKEAAGSGWAKTWQLIFGDLNEAIELFTGISNVIGGVINASSDARNKMLKDWKDLGGRAAILKGLGNILKTFGNIIKPIGEAFREVFPPTTGKILSDLSNKFLALTEKFKVGSKVIENIKNTFRGFFIILEFFINILKILGIIGFKVVGFLSPIVGVILNVTSSLGNGIKNIKEFFSAFKDIDFSGLDGLSDKMKKRFTPLLAIGEAFDFIKEKAIIFKNTIEKVFIAVKKAILENIEFPKFDFNTTLDVLNAGLFSGILFGITRFIKSFSKITKTLDNGIKGIFGNVDVLMQKIKIIFTELQSTLKTFQTQMKAKTLMTIATAIAILAGSILVLSLIDTVKLSISLGAITVLFGELAAMMMLIEKKIGKRRFNSTADVVYSMIGLSIALYIMASSLSKIAKHDPANIAAAVGAMTVLMGSIAGLMLLMEKKIGKRRVNNSTKTAMSMIGISVALYIMASALSKLAELNTNQLIKAGIAVGILMLMIGGMMVAMDKLKKTGNLTGLAVSMVALSIGLFIFSKALAKMGSLSIEQIGKGLLALGGSLAIIGAAFKVMPKDLASKAAGLAVIGIAVLILAKALEVMGGMKIEEVGKALLMLGGSLLILTIAMNAMSGGLAGAAALTVMAIAIDMLVPSIVALGNLKIESIGKALLALAGVFTIIGLAAFILGPLTPLIFALAAGIVLLGVACLAAGVGLLAFATGFAILASVGAAGGAVLIDVAKRLIGLIPYLATQLAIGFINFLKVIQDNAVLIAQALGTLVLEIIKEFANQSLLIINTVLKFLLDLGNAILSKVPELIYIGMQILLAFLKGIRDNIREIVVVSLEIITELIKGLNDGLPNLIKEGMSIMVSFVNGLAEGIRSNIDEMIKASENLASAIIEGLVKGLVALIKAPVKAAMDVGKAIIDAIKDSIDAHSPSKEAIKIAGYIDEGLKIGLLKNSKSPIDAAKNVGYSVLNGLQTVLNSANNLAINELNLQPVITPVLDLSSIKSQNSKLDNLLSTKSISIGETTSNRLSGILNNTNTSNITVEKEPVQVIKEIKPSFIINANGFDEGSIKMLMNRINKELGLLI